jgi:hypothetical protein
MLTRRGSRFIPDDIGTLFALAALRNPNPRINTPYGVVNVASAPRRVPASLLATRRKWYVVAGVSDPIAADVETGLAPDPAPLLGVAFP